MKLSLLLVLLLGCGDNIHPKVSPDAPVVADPGVPPSNGDITEVDAGVPDAATPDAGTPCHDDCDTHCDEDTDEDSDEHHHHHHGH